MKTNRRVLRNFRFQGVNFKTSDRIDMMSAKYGHIIWFEPPDFIPNYLRLSTLADTKIIYDNTTQNN